LADRVHGPPIIWLAPVLHLIELMSRCTPGRLRKRTQIVECAASELDGLGLHHSAEYTKFCIDWQLPFHGRD
jgi:hypothetical protein